MKILIVGKNSFIAKYFINFIQFEKYCITAISHNDVYNFNFFNDFTHIINFSYDNNLILNSDNIKNSVDYHICNKINSFNTNYIFISSRKVYDLNFQFLANENTIRAVHDMYSNNKIIIEDYLFKIKHCKVLILRPSNIIGFEYYKERYRFASFLINNLIMNGNIQLNCSPDTKKDIIPINNFCIILNDLIKNDVTGVYNIGSGSSFSLTEICLAIIKGYGSGSLISYNNSIIDEFELDSTKLYKLIGFNPTNDVSPLDYLYEIGKFYKSNV